MMQLNVSGQIQVAKPVSENNDSPTQGFFVKGGSEKLTALECYNFKDLIVSFDLKDEYFGYDQVTIKLCVSGKYDETFFKYTMSMAEFKLKFKDQNIQ